MNRWNLKGILAAFVISVVALVVYGQASEPNLLRNGDFEQIDQNRNVPRYWRVSDWSHKAQRGKILLASVTDDVAEGKAAAKIVYEGRGSNLVLYQDVARKGRMGYTLRLRCKAPKGKWAYASAVCLPRGKIVLYANAKRVPGDGAWHPVELTFVASEETEIIRVILRSNGNALFDDARLVANPSAQTQKQTTGPRSQQEPSTARELATWRSTVSAQVLKADKARKAKMSPEELAWERVLEENLGSFYLPRYKQAKAKGAVTAWDYVKDEPNLPRVLLIGDSISRGYTVPVRKALAGKVNVHRAPANCGSTSKALKKLSVWLGGGKWDLIHFNFGIHDRRSTPEEYAQRLEKIVGILLSTGAKLVWASSTPLSGKMIQKTNTDPMVRLNAAAAQVMKKHGIPIDDLYAVVKPKLSSIQCPDGCHYRPEGYRMLGQAVAKCIIHQLGMPGT